MCQDFRERFEKIGDEYELSRDSLDIERFSTRNDFADCPQEPLAAYLRNRFPYPPLWQLGYTEHETAEIGGQAVIARCRDKAIDRVLVLKTVKQEKDSEKAQYRLINEALLLGQLLSPGVPPVYVLAENDGRPCYAMPDMGKSSGFDKPIQEFHKRGGLRGDHVRFRELLAQFTAACRTVAYAHSKNIIHRDLKPSNILISPFGEVFVADWGLAKRLDAASADESENISDGELAELIPERIAAETTEGKILGTLSYMSPEQALGQRSLDSRTDIFSLGATLYEVLTGSPPYDGRDVEANQKAVFARPRLHHPVVPPALEAVCLKAMSERREDRYGSALDLAEEIKRWLADEPVTAYPEPWPLRLQRWIKRHRTRVIIGAIVFLCVAAIAAILRGRLQEMVTDARVEAATLAEKGRFDEAADKLSRAIQELKKKPFLLVDPKSIVAQRDLYVNMDKFRESSDRAWFYAGEERGDETLEACHAALGRYGVLDSSDWTKSLAASGLPKETITTLKAEVHRILVLKASMHLEAGILAHSLSDANVVELSSKLALEALQRAGELVTGGEIPPSNTAAVLQLGSFALLRLKNKSGLATSNAPSAGTTGAAKIVDGLTAEDAFFLGVMHVYLAKHPTDSFAKTITMHGPGGFDLAHPRDTAVAMLRRAVRLEPSQFWSNFMLGRILAFPDPQSGVADYAEALQAFNNCVSLRRDYSRGYEQRALTLALQSVSRGLGSNEHAEAQRRESLRQDALDDLAFAIKLAAPDDPSVHWVCGQTYDLLDRPTDAVVAYTLALEKEKNLQGKVSLRNQLEGARALANRLLKSKPTDPAAKRLFELIDQANKP